MGAKQAIQTITTHYIDGAFVPSHGREVMDIIRPTDSQVIGRVTLGDAEDTRRAIAAAKRALTTFGRGAGKSARRYCTDCTRPHLRTSAN
jgi:aldehyde dehydrogenase (NAD+)